MKRAHAALMLTVAAAIVAGCGGGGGSSTSPPASGHSSGGAGSTARFTIVVPPKSTTAQSGRRRPQFISPSTQSVAITVTAATQGSANGTPTGAPAAAASGSAPTIANLTPASAGCSTSSAGLSCTVSLGAPIGTDTFTMTFYDGLNATGNILSTGSTTATIAAGVPFAVSVVNGGVPAKVLASIAASPAPEMGNVYLNVQAYDADGNAIVGTYASPLPVIASGALPITLSTNALATTTTQVQAQFSPSPPTNGTWTTGSVAIGSGSAAASITFPLTNIQLYPIPMPTPVFPYGFARAADGNSLWFPALSNSTFTGTGSGVSSSAAAMVKLTFDGSMTVYALPADSSPSSPVLGGDGNIWFTNVTAPNGTALSFIDSISPSGAITAYPITGGTINSIYFDNIGTDPSGNIYYGLNISTGYGSAIGEANVPDAATQAAFPAPVAPGSPLPTYVYPRGTPPPASNPIPGQVAISPAYFAQGSDGNVWWVDPSFGFVGSVTPVTSSNPGVYTVYPVGPTSYGLNNFYAGSDGNLYYTAVGAIWQDDPGIGTPGVVGKVATNGTVTEYPVPKQYVVEIARIGLGNALYATASESGGALLRIGTDGTVGVLPVKDDGAPIDFFYNTSAGAFYYDDASNGAVGRYTIAPGWRSFPENMTIDAVGATRYVGIVESGNAGPYTAVSSNTAVATVAAGPAVPNVTDFLITSVAPGNAVITLQDTHGRTATVTVTVTQTTGTISSTHRRPALRGLRR